MKRILLVAPLFLSVAASSYASQLVCSVSIKNTATNLPVTPTVVSANINARAAGVQINHSGLLRFNSATGVDSVTSRVRICEQIHPSEMCVDIKVQSKTPFVENEFPQVRSGFYVILIDQLTQKSVAGAYHSSSDDGEVLIVDGGRGMRAEMSCVTRY